MARAEKSCGAVVEKDGKVLMVHQDNGVVAFPKGHVEPGESEVETAVREIKEETGIDAKIDESKRFEIFYHIDESDIDKTVVLFIGEPIGNTKPKAQDGEITEAMWADVSSVEEKLQFEEWKNVWSKIKEEL